MCRSVTSIQEKITKPKLGLLDLGKRLGSVSQACNVMSYLRERFYRFKQLYEQGGAEALMGLSRKKPFLKNRVPEHVERVVFELAIETQPWVRSAPVGSCSRRALWCPPLASARSGCATIWKP